MHGQENIKLICVYMYMGILGRENSKSRDPQNT